MTPGVFLGETSVSNQKRACYVRLDDARASSSPICGGSALRAAEPGGGLRASQLTDANWPVCLLTCGPLASPWIRQLADSC